MWRRMPWPGYTDRSDENADSDTTPITKAEISEISTFRQFQARVIFYWQLFQNLCYLPDHNSQQKMSEIFVAALFK